LNPALHEIKLAKETSFLTERFFKVDQDFTRSVSAMSFASFAGRQWFLLQLKMDYGCI
jgi:hypothetical protein